MALASAQVALTAASTYSQYTALKAQGKYQEKIADSNARFDELRAEDALARGATGARENNQKTKALIGSQRAALAAQGIDVESGSALDVQQDSAGRGALDALTIKNNAWREAWGYKIEAANTRAAGKMANLSARSQAKSTLLTGGLNAATAIAGGYDRYDKAGGTKYKWV